jgi:cytochrome bd-type quinol oxidase subunit 2
MAPDLSHSPANRRRLNRILMVVPIFCSLLALGLVLGNVAAGVERQADESTSAHLFQLLIALQLPLVLLFAATADWTRPARPLLALLVQALAGLAALGALAWAGY